MRIISFDEFGPPEVLHETEAPTPQPGRGEVVVAVEAAGVCHHDVLHRAGRLPKATPGGVLGHEVAGTISAVGEGVDPTMLGRRVVAYNRVFCGRCENCLGGRHDLCRRSAIVGTGVPGGYAEYLCLPSVSAIAVPAGIEAAAAALAVCPIGTSLRAVTVVGGLEAGDVLVVVGAGGLGVHEIQIGRARGADVIVVTSSPEKRTLLESLGARVVVAPDGSFRKEVWEATGGKGADVVAENVVTQTLAESQWTLRPGGTMVVLGNVGVKDVQINPGLLIGRRLRVIGSGNPTFSDVSRALAMMERRVVQPQIRAVVPFPEAARAHAMLEARKMAGRVVLSGWES